MHALLNELKALFPGRLAVNIVQTGNDRFGVALSNLSQEQVEKLAAWTVEEDDRELEASGHQLGCVCADCSGAIMDAEND